MKGRKQEPKPKHSEPCPPTHDFSRRMGVGCCIRTVHDDGIRLSLYGWTDDTIREGDYLILAHEDREHTARYRLTAFQRPGDPRDMWFGEATFAPRPSAGSVAP